MDHLRTVFGIPAHPLFVHVPVVLLPLVALGAIAMVVSARVRERFGWLVLALAVVAGLSTQLAIGTGQALRSRVPRSAALTHHVQIAESIRPLALLLFLATLAVMLEDRRHRPAWPFGDGHPWAAHRRQGPPAATTGMVLGALTVVLAVGTTVRLWQIGDSGAKATWQRVVTNGQAVEGPAPAPAATARR